MYESLVERIFEVKSEAKLAASLFGHLSDWQEYRYAWAIYIDGESPSLVDGYLTGSLEGNETTGFKTDFKEFLDQIQPSGFLDHLFALDFYKLRRTVEDFIFPRTFDYLPVVDDILQDSRGFLLWHHQLELLFRGFYDDTDKVVNLRKGINARDPEAFEMAGSLMLGATSLEDVIWERMVLGHTLFQNVKGALLLSHYGKVLN